MPWTIYRYILKDLLRLIVLSSLVMVFVISFAGALKPLSESRLEPLTLIKFVFYSVPTLLALVIPFAAAFASTLVFSRMVTDNEIVACAAGGISYRLILLPAFFLGLVLTLSLYFLSNWVVPYFFQQTKMMLQRDVAALVVGQVRQGRPVELPGTDGWVVYAEDAELSELTGRLTEHGRTPDRLIMLRDVVVGRFDAADKLRDQYMAEQADIYLYRDEGGSWANLVMRAARLYQSETDHFLELAQPRLGPFLLPDPLKSDPRFLSMSDLERLSKQPDLYPRVARRRHKLARSMARDEVIWSLQRELDPAAGSGRAVLIHKVGQEDQRCVVTAPRVLREGSRLELGGTEDVPLRFEKYINNVLVHKVEAPSARLSVKTSQVDDEPTIVIDVDQPTVHDQRDKGRAPGHPPSYTIRGARLSQDVLSRLLQFRSPALLRQVDSRFSRSDDVKSAAVTLDNALRKLKRNIVSQLHERYALAVISMLVLLLGAVLSMKMRGAMPLVVYFWSFLLALVAVFITRSGEDLMSKVYHPPSLGLMVLWTGVLMLCVAIGVLYVKLAKN